jgi:hypothetical protein
MELGAGVLEIVVGEIDVSVREAVVGVLGGGEGDVPVPLQAATNNTIKSINRFMDSIICRLHP